MADPGRRRWWRGKVRQFGRHVTARVTTRERASLAEWLTPPQLALFDRMHVADQRHGLDVGAALRSEGVRDTDVLLAGLLHDAGKGRTGLWPRVAWSLTQAYGTPVARLVERLPGMRDALRVLSEHAETSARLAAAAGCSPRTVELIRHQDAPRDPDYGELLRLADDAA